MNKESGMLRFAGARISVCKVFYTLRKVKEGGPLTVERRFAGIVFMIGSQVLLAFFMFIIPSLSSILKQDLALTSAGIGALTMAVFAGFGLFAFFTGKLTDRFPFERSYLIGHGIVAICLVAAGFSRNLWQLFTLLFLCGLGDSLVSNASARVMVWWFPEKGRATASSIYKTGFPLGAALAALVLPHIALLMGWQWVFRLVGVFIGLWGVAVYVLFGLRQDGEERSVVTLSSRPRSRPPSPRVRNRVYLVGSVGMFSIIIQYCIMTYLVLYLTQEAGYALLFSASMLSLIQFVGTGARLAAGVVSDFLVGNRATTMFLSFVLCPFGILLLLNPVSVTLVYAACFLLGLSVIGWVPLWLTMAAEAAPREYSGWSTGIAFSINSVGGLVGPPIFGMIADSRFGYSMAFVFLIGVCAVNLILLALLRHPLQKEPSPRPSSGNSFS